MKRDMDLIRRILLEAEADDKPNQVLQYTDPHEAYNVALLEEAGLVVATITRGYMNKPGTAFLTRLTWSGHDFLDATKDDTIWRKAKDKVLKPGISWTFFC
jgi:hypothetical protein